MVIGTLDDISFLPQAMQPISHCIGLLVCWMVGLSHLAFLSYLKFRFLKVFQICKTTILIITAPAQLITVPAQLITAPAQPPAKRVAVSMALLIPDSHRLIDKVSEV